MKAGTENRSKVILMLALAIVAVFMVARTFFTSASTSPVISPKTETAGKTATRATVPKARTQGKSWRTVDETVSSLDPTLRFDWLKNSEAREYTGGRRNIFNMEPEPPPAPKVAVNTGPKCPGDPGCPPPPPVCPGPDPRCPPPPINLKFFGFKSEPGQPKRVFLSSGEDVFIAGEGDVVNRRYRVVKINPGSVEIEDVLNNNKQTIPLSQG